MVMSVSHNGKFLVASGAAVEYMIVLEALLYSLLGGLPRVTLSVGRLML